MAMHDLDRVQIGGRETETYEFGGGGGGGRIFNEQQEWELASELLEVGNEQEFEQFLGDLISKAGSAIGSFIKSDTGRAIGGVLKGPPASCCRWPARRSAATSADRPARR